MKGGKGERGKAGELIGEFVLLWYRYGPRLEVIIVYASQLLKAPKVSQALLG